MDKIPFKEFVRRLNDLDVPERELGKLLIRAPTNDTSLFDLKLIPNPSKVEIRDEQESALTLGNGLCRRRRERRFLKALEKGDQRPVLVSEGDSWFQFPFLIEDVVDHLGEDYLIWSLDAAGDTASNMIDLMPEYPEALHRWKDQPVRAFLLSAAGNDIIGEDKNGMATLSRLLKPLTPDKGATEHIDWDAVRNVLAMLEQAYRKVVRTVREVPGQERLPILIHGYDYAIPGGFPGDQRNPIYARRDQWLGRPLVAKGIVDPELQRNIIRLLIDALYEMLGRVAGNATESFVFLVDVRDAIGPDQWNDEIHGTDTGFAAVAVRFRAALRNALQL